VLLTSVAAFSPDGAHILSGTEKTAKIWRTRTAPLADGAQRGDGALLLDLKGHTDTVTSAAFSPDGARVLTGSHDGTAKLWDASTGIPQLEVLGQAAVHAVALSL